MSSQPSKFIITSDFPTLKNDSSVSGEIIISGGISIAGNSYVEGYGDVNISTIGAINRGRISSSKNSGASAWYTGQNMAFERTGTASGSPAVYTVYAFMSRISATTLRMHVYIPNPYSVTLTGEAGDDTITLYTNTFIAPYA